MDILRTVTCVAVGTAAMFAAEIVWSRFFPTTAPAVEATAADPVEGEE